MKTTTLTKEEFIKRSMAGEVFEFNGNRYFYDDSFTYKRESPFMFNENCMDAVWRYMDGKTLFNIV